MNTLEKLKELNATTGKRKENEDLGHWADREGLENMWVRDVALPDLLAVVEAAREYKTSRKALGHVDTPSEIRLYASLAKLTEDAHD